VAAGCILPARVAACKLKPASRTDSGALITRPASDECQLGPGWSETRDGGSRELCERRIGLGELVRNGAHVGVRVDGDDSLALEITEDAGGQGRLSILTGFSRDRCVARGRGEPHG
jgi:hypothetical protein